MHLRNNVWLSLVLVCSWVCTCAPDSVAGKPTYWQDIRPIFRKHCTVCHSAKNAGAVEVSGGLALDTFASALKGAKRPVIQSGKSGDSPLVQRITTANEENRMPLAAPAVSAENIALIRKWIDSGAKEGEKPRVNAAVTSSTFQRRRKLDVVLTTNASPPAGILGPGAPEKLELVLPVGPLSPVAAVAFHPEGKLFAEAGYGRVTIWDLDLAKPVTILTSVLGAVNDLRFSPNGRLLAVAGGQPSAKGEIRIYRVEDWKLQATFREHADVVFCVAFHPDGQRLASASYDKTVGIWNIANHKLERTLTHHSDFVYSVAFSPDGKWLVSSSKDRTARIIDPDTGKSMMTFSGMEQDVLAVAVHPDGKSVVTSGYESGLYWWNPQNGERTRLQRGHGNAVHEICFSKDGKLVASAGGDRTVRLWDGTSGAMLRTLPVGSVTYAAALSPNGKLAASGSFDGFVRLWDSGTGRHLVTLMSFPGDKGTLNWLAVTPEGFAASSSQCNTLAQWRMTGKLVSADLIWKALQKPEMIAKAVRGENVGVPSFTK